jgi:aminopeptidase N
VVLNARLYDPDQTISGSPTGIFFESTIAHEAGHQWFYNLVGNDQLDEPWLDEALTQYVTYLYYRDVYGPSAADSFRQSFLSRWDRVDRAEIPIGLPAVDYYGGPTYGAIVYGRGPLFFEALAEEMGPQAFETFLKDYTQQHKWGIGTGEALRDLAESHSDWDLSAVFAEWVYEP